MKPNKQTTNETMTSLTIEPNQPADAPTVLLKPKRKVRRNGSIARLPKFERDLVNQMLQDGSPYRGIVMALDELGHTVTARNISNWAQGGYQDWLHEQERVLENRSRQDRLVDLLREEEATQLPEVGLQLAATALSELLAQPSMQLDHPQGDLDKYLRIIRTLCRLSRELLKLQKYRDDSARLLGEEHSPEQIKKQNQETFDSLRQDFSKQGMAILAADIKANEAGIAPASNGVPPGESLTLQVMRGFLERVRARREQAAPATPSSPASVETNENSQPHSVPHPEKPAAALPPT